MTKTWCVEILDKDGCDSLCEEYFTGTKKEVESQAKYIREEALAGNIRDVNPEDVGDYSIREID